MAIAVTRQTLWVLIIPSTALVTLTPSKVRSAVASATGIAARRGTASQRAITRDTVGVVVIASDTLVTTRSTETLTAETMSRLLIADFVQSSTDVTIAV